MLGSLRRPYCTSFSPSISFHSYLVTSFFQTWLPPSLQQNLLYHLFYPWDFYPFDEAQSHLYLIKPFNFASSEPSFISFLWSPGLYPHAFLPQGFIASDAVPGTGSVLSLKTGFCWCFSGLWRKTGSSLLRELCAVVLQLSWPTVFLLMTQFSNGSSS